MNKKFIMVLAALLLTCSQVSAQSDAIRLSDQLKENASRYGTVGQSIYLLKGNKVLHRQQAGFASLELSVPMAEQLQFPAYSIAKLFTSVTLMKLVEAGKVDLDRGIGEYLPDLPRHWHAITVRHCLNHTSGLPEYFKPDYLTSGFPASTSDIYLALNKSDFQFETGTRNNYNNTNFLIISDIISSVSQNPFMHVLRETVIKPANLQHTFYSSAKHVIPNLVSSYTGKQGQLYIDKGVDWPEYAFSHSALYTSVEDVAKFMLAIKNGKLLKPITLKQMWQPMALNDGSPGRYASGWQYSASDQLVQVGHEGGNRVRLDFYFDPDDIQNAYTLVYFTNGDAHDGWTSQLADSVMATVLEPEFPVAALREAVLDCTFNPCLAQEWQRLSSKLSGNERVQEFGEERFIRYLGYNLFSSAQPQYVVSLFEFYIGKYPDAAIGWDHLAQAWLLAGDKNKAKAFFEKALKQDPQFGNAKRQLEQLVLSEN